MYYWGKRFWLGIESKLWDIKVIMEDMQLCELREEKERNTELNPGPKSCCFCCEVASVVSNPVRPHRQQPTGILCPRDSPGKNTGVGCHFLLQCMKVKSESEVAQSCLTRRDPMDCSLRGSSIHGIFQARVLEWGDIAFSRTQGPILGSSKC